MEYYPFPALFTANGTAIREFGQASLSPNGNALDFTGDFVPLLPLGTEATVAWIQGDRRLAVFEGKVYLSSKTLMRLVDIEPSLLASVRTVLATNARIPALLWECDDDASGNGSQASGISAEILYLSTDLFKLKATDFVSANQTVLVSAEVDFLTLHHLPLQVRERVVLRRDDTLLICQPLPTNEENFIALTAYAAKLAAAEKKTETQ